MIENVMLSIVLRRKTKLQASFRDVQYMRICICVAGGERLGVGLKRRFKLL